MSDTKDFGECNMRIGVYVCHCGGNISDLVDVEKVVAATEEQGDVILSRAVEHMCSEEGRKHILEDVKQQNLDRVVVAACSPLFHEKTFMTSIEKAGLNPYLLEMANIREQCSWCQTSRHGFSTVSPYRSGLPVSDSWISDHRKDQGYGRPTCQL